MDSIAFINESSLELLKLTATPQGSGLKVAGLAINLPSEAAKEGHASISSGINFQDAGWGPVAFSMRNGPELYRRNGCGPDWAFESLSFNTSWDNGIPSRTCTGQLDHEGDLSERVRELASCRTLALTDEEEIFCLVKLDVGSDFYGQAYTVDDPLAPAPPFTAQPSLGLSDLSRGVVGGLIIHEVTFSQAEHPLARLLGQDWEVQAQQGGQQWQIQPEASSIQFANSWQASIEITGWSSRLTV